ncbi:MULTISPECIES: D-alanyl-D-alanine carboxypeptidase/D-alanyl-D-alanine-endopeptidase [unclassified Dyella]|uniref:D-alanyl-D-alanine carboxypeptidase/D-alanyl-D-alanine endopeptidase n=1 Tax=unclassified Dyella TaxID=2634549 RepID=UPI000C83ABD3|nr:MULTISPECIES: D-alanyl-D-alanine carboxypeptidase/D-alanyl-D-alanine-endopeptidase [unclassified Dyella]MDR3445698.1 D-alanyl-D-alanine carboxypeptidase/D-alanyl-D-alanine-endopeptidase [Dyella sp.]
MARPYRLLCRCTAALFGMALVMPSTAGQTAPTPGPATSAPTRAATTLSLTDQIDNLIGQPRFAGADWGIAVISLSSGRTIYNHHADQLFQPASTTKLFTAAVALSELGPDYRIPTRVFAGGEIHNGKLDGPLILYGMGDPTLGVDAATLHWADQLAEQLAAQGLKHVHGDLIADATYFASPMMGSGWEATDLQSWFAVPTSALSVGENQVEVTVAPGVGAGAPALLHFDPDDAIPAVTNDVLTSAQRTRNDVNLYRAPGDDTLYAFGNIAAKSTAQNYKLALPDPAQFAGRQLQQALLRHGIQLDGKLVAMHWPRRDTFLPNQPRTLAEVLSPPVSDILERGLKRSQNLYLQNLLLLAGVKAQADTEQREGSMGFITSERWGIRAMHQMLEQIGIAPAASLIEEGSGLSRRNLATPNAMARLLAFLASQPYGPTLVQALPIAGIDGTLQWRMRNTPAENNVHAKTGSMSFVHCLAGYVTSGNGERLAFAIMLNNYDPPNGAPSATKDIDQIAELLASSRNTTGSAAMPVAATHPAN